MDDTESASVPFLTKNENSNDYDYAQRTKLPSLRQYLPAVIRIFVYLLAGWGVFSLYRGTRWSQPTRDVYRPDTLPVGLNLCDCGSTVDEALSRDCVYDALSAAWLPPYCRDDELTAEFERAGPGADGAWTYYLDENATIPLTKAEIGALGETGGSFWASSEWHLAHCVFNWQKLVRMRDTGAVMETRYDSLMHAKHCSRLLLGPTRHYAFLIEVPVMMNSTDEPTRQTGITTKVLIHDTLNLSQTS